MKQILKRFLCVLLTAAVILTGNVYHMPEVSAAADLTWELSINLMRHKQLDLSVSKVDAAQTVTAHITAGSDTFTRELELKRHSQDFEITLEKGYGQGTKFSVYLETADHKKTMTATYTESGEHDIGLLNEHATPKQFTAQVYHKGLVNNVSVEVGIGDVHSKEVGQDGMIQVDYPAQSEGDKIQVTWGDGFCQRTREYVIKSRNLSIGGLNVTRSNISAYGLDDDVRLHAKIDGVDYYTAYGRDYKTSKPLFTFPVQPVGQSVELWLEAEDGSIQKLRTVQIEACEMSWGDTRFMDCYPQRISDWAPDNASYVIAKIGNNEYKGSVKNGKFTITYPRHNDGTSVSLTGYDEHGCSSEVLNKTIYNEYRNYKTEKEFRKAFPGRASGSSPFYSRLCAEINGKVYYGNYPNTSTGTVYVSYPLQPIGTKIKFWFESSNGSYTNTITRTVGKKDLEATIKALSVNRLSGEFYTTSDDGVPPKYIRATINGKTYNGTFKKDDFSSYTYNISFPQQKVGSKVTVTVEDIDGCKTYASSSIKNRPIKFSIINDQIEYGDNEVWGETVPGTKITIKIGNHTYTGTAQKDGLFFIGIGSFRTGTKVSIKAVAPNGYYRTINTSVKKAYCKVKVKNTQFTKTKYANIQCTGANKGEKLKIKVSGKTITRKFKSNNYKQSFKIKLPKKKAGKSIKVIIYDKYGDQRASTTKRIYIGRTIKVGMSAKKAVLTTWGKPVYKRKAKKGYKEWGFIRGNYGLIALIKKGKVAKVYKGRLD